MPVATLIIWAVNMMRPEYWILSSLLATVFTFSGFCLISGVEV
jgi:hypothetical protein